MVMENEIKELFERSFGKSVVSIDALPLSGSARRYFRIECGEESYIGVSNSNLEENRLFIDFTRHFRQRNLPVPEVYAVADDMLTYIQQDLGPDMLLDVVEREREREREREGEELGGHLTELYRKALVALLRMQTVGGEGLDYSQCVPRPVFDRQCVMWDLNYFKYCFLRLAAVDFSEQEMEMDFFRLADNICCEPTDGFMFRDFQSRNIMVKDDEVFFIDYQGGRRGALHYDVASLLYDAIVGIPEFQREDLLSFYIGLLGKDDLAAASRFRRSYYHFVLIRLLQAMGAFGLRGLHEKKQHFIDSIVPGLKNIQALLAKEELRGVYPAIERACRMALVHFKAL